VAGPLEPEIDQGRDEASGKNEKLARGPSPRPDIIPVLTAILAGIQKIVLNLKKWITILAMMP
jgi:hypothetical protein